MTGAPGNAAFAGFVVERPLLRLAIHHRWARGLAPGYAPTIADLYLLTVE